MLEIELALLAFHCVVLPDYMIIGKLSTDFVDNLVENPYFCIAKNEIMAESALKGKIEVSRLDHHEDLEKVSDVIETICEEKNVIGFRFTYNPATAEDVIPNAYKTGDTSYNPSKEELDNLPYKLRKKYATARGLSMFTSPEAAQTKAQQLSKNVEKKAGIEEAEQYKEEHPYITKFIIPASSGVVTEPNKDKHFNFFPYEGVEVLNLIDDSFGYIKIDYDEN